MSPDRRARDRRIRELRAKDWALAAIGAEVGLSDERVRQVLAATTPEGSPPVDDEVLARRARFALERRFWAGVDAKGECWSWSRYRLSNGYGRISIGNRQMEYTHRLSWLLHFGPIPEGLWVLHRCDNPPCVRPDHLFLGTAADNARDRDRKGRDAHSRRLTRGLIA